MASSIPSIGYLQVLVLFLLVTALRLISRNKAQFDGYTSISLCEMSGVQLLAYPAFERLAAAVTPLNAITVAPGCFRRAGEDTTLGCGKYAFKKKD